MLLISPSTDKTSIVILLQQLDGKHSLFAISAFLWQTLKKTFVLFIQMETRLMEANQYRLTRKNLCTNQTLASNKTVKCQLYAPCKFSRLRTSVLCLSVTLVFVVYFGLISSIFNCSPLLLTQTKHHFLTVTFDSICLKLFLSPNSHRMHVRSDCY